MDFFDTHISEEAIKMVTKILKCSYINVGEISCQPLDCVEKNLKLKNSDLKGS